MIAPLTHTLCWVPTWNENEAYKGIGLEHLLLSEYAADSTIVAFDDALGPFRLSYKLTWDEGWQLHRARLTLTTEQGTRSLQLQTDGLGHWQNGIGGAMPALEGCRDIDIWPTPFTNMFPIHREPMDVGERREFLMAWVDAPNLTVQPQAQAYTRLAEHLYLFESLDGSGFKAELPVDEFGFVTDYPELFRRVA